MQKHVTTTSLDAYAELQISLPRREVLVWTALAQCVVPPTSYELTERMKADGLAKDLNSTRPRLTALLKKRCVQTVGKRICTVTGKRVFTWWAIAGRPPIQPKVSRGARPVVAARLF